MLGLKFVRAAIGSLDDGILSISGSKGAHAEPAQDGSDGAPAAMQNITVGGITYSSDPLTNVVFNGTTVTLDGSTLNIQPLQGNDGQDGNDGAPATMQNITVGGNTYESSTLSSVVSNGATATLDNGVLNIQSLQGLSLIHI